MAAHSFPRFYSKGSESSSDMLSNFDIFEEVSNQEILLCKTE